MKFSLHLASQIAKTYKTGVDPRSYDVDEIVQRLGLQLGAIEHVEKFAEKYKDIVIAKVVSCEKHPNADKLSLCFVDDGGVVAHVERNDEGFVQIVCGAPNVRAGLHVVWIPPGATVPSSHGSEPFILEARELRGKISNGMIASPKELAINDEHEGILELSAESIGRAPVIGEKFSGILGMDDVVIDCENKMFTHRPDCFGNIGIARELSGIFGDVYSSPEWLKHPIEHEVTDKLQLHAENSVQELVPRFMVQAISNVKVKQSPLWLQSYLQRIGQKSVNNIVDYTNFFMMETGQPLHTFDYDKVKKLSTTTPTIQPRLANKGETISLLNGKTINLDENDIVIATDNQAIALAGVMGGAETEVDESTQNIIIEVANFDMYAIRRSSMRHGLFTDAVARFNKGQSPLQNDRVLAKMVDEIVRHAEGRVASEAFDISGFELSGNVISKVDVNAQFINERLGSNLSANEMKTLLENVEFLVAIENDTLHITVPFWRMDIAIAEDVVEEIGRLHGYHNLPVELPLRSTKPVTKNPQLTFKSVLRKKLALAGANEVLTYSFVHGDLLKNSGINSDQWAYHLRNAISPDLHYYRTSLIPSLLAKVHGNLKAQAGSSTNQFALFEIGKAHVKGRNEDEDEDNSLPKQMSRLGFVYAADSKTAKKLHGASFFVAKKYIDALSHGQAKYLPLDTNDDPITSPYQLGRSAKIYLGDSVQPIGVIGEFRASVAEKLKLPEFCAGFELDIDELRQRITPQSYQTLSTFPATHQDITFEVPNDTSWSDMNDFINADIHVSAAADNMSYNVEPLDIYQGENSDKKRMTFRIHVTHHHKTLITNEVNTLLDSLAEAVYEKLHAVRI